MPTTRQRVLAAARTAFRGGPGPRPTATPTLAEVAAAAGVSRATLHRHFPSRDHLLAALDLGPPPSTTERILSTALELLAERGLAQLSMDELAARAGVSRASLYRRFPGKPALFRELVRVYSPLEPVATRLAQLRDRPPEEVMPELALAVARHLDGRIGLVRSLLFEATGPSTEAEAGREFAVAAALAPLVQYLLAQMEAGRLRRVHPVLALQSFAGAIAFHLLTRPLAERLIGFDVPLEESVTTLAAAWVRGLQA
jgi:AcrR family transcriptional regulator